MEYSTIFEEMVPLADGVVVTSVLVEDTVLVKTGVEVDLMFWVEEISLESCRAVVSVLLCSYVSDVDGTEMETLHEVTVSVEMELITVVTVLISQVESEQEVTVAVLVVATVLVTTVVGMLWELVEDVVMLVKWAVLEVFNSSVEISELVVLWLVSLTEVESKSKLAIEETTVVAILA